MARVYAPITAQDLDELDQQGRVTPSVAFAVTRRLAGLLPEEDIEGHEHLATQFAAAACTSDPAAVLALELPDAAFEARDGEADAPPGLVALPGGAPARSVVCFLVADLGARVSEDADVELSWYDAGEAGAVRELMSHRG